MDIYISSIAFAGQEVEDIIRVIKSENLALEFSSGMPYKDNMEQLYLAADIKKIPHNYFPAPKKPFVLNLASSDDEIRKQSIEHCVNGLHLSKQAGAPFFSAHAGFCIDPNPNELGKKISYEDTYDKEYHKAIFLESVKTILKEAKLLEINFLIENNVIAPFNLIGSNNPLLCCESNEIKWLFEQINDSTLGLLLDTAHLKVSCKTLDLNLLSELDQIRKFILAIHHSDNNGESDNNKPMPADYWFLPYIKTYNEILHVIEVKEIGIEKIKEQVKLLQKYGC